MRKGPKRDRLCQSNATRPMLSPEQIDPNTEVTPQDGMVIQVGKRRFAPLRLK